MANPLLSGAQPAPVLERVAAVVEHVGKEALIGPRQLVAGFLGTAFRKRRLRAEPFLDIAPPPLDEVGHEAVLVERLGRIAIEVGFEQPEQRSKAFLDAAVRRGGDQKNVAIRIAGELAEQLVPLMLGARGCSARTRRCVRLVDNHEIRSLSKKSVALRSRFHEIDAGDEIRILRS
jgi:hypothetical protein